MIVIGLVVHRSRRAVFEEAGGALTGVALEWVEYEHENDVRELVQDLLARRHLGGLLLGPVPYAACRDLLPGGLCVEVIEPTELDLALAFFRATARGWKPTPVSVDTFEPAVVQEVAEALDLDRDAIGCMAFEPEKSPAEIVDFHRRYLHRAGGGYLSPPRCHAWQPSNARPKGVHCRHATSPTPWASPTRAGAGCCAS